MNAKTMIITLALLLESVGAYAAGPYGDPNSCIYNCPQPIPVVIVPSGGR